MNPPYPTPLLQIRDLQVRFPVRPGFLRRSTASVRAVDGVSLDLAPGEALGLVGESGCGKSTLGRAIVRLVSPSAGSIHLDGIDLLALSPRDLRASRRQVQMIFQDPFGSLNPRLTIGQTLAEPLEIHRLAPDRASRHHRIQELLRSVGLEPEHAHRYPHEFSGGQRQRIGIARALAVEPRLIICDEPVSALDVSVQAQVVNLLHDLQLSHGLAYLFISHDLAVVEHLCARIAVMYLGRIVELGPTSELTSHPRHPYTQALLSSVPVLDPARRRQRILLQGEVPSPLNPPPGCPFHPRCPIAEARCKTDLPALRPISPGLSVACHLAT